MEAHKWLDNQHSPDIEAALKRFEDVCNTLEVQHTKLLDLEKRREKLNEDLQSLRNEIKMENNYFRSIVDENVVDGMEGVDENFRLGTMVEPATLDTVAIKKFINNQKEELASSKEEMELEQLKMQRRKVTAEPIHQHVDEEKCIITEIMDTTTEPTRFSEI